MQVEFKEECLFLRIESEVVCKNDTLIKRKSGNETNTTVLILSYAYPTIYKIRPDEQFLNCSILAKDNELFQLGGRIYHESVAKVLLDDDLTTRLSLFSNFESLDTKTRNLLKVWEPKGIPVTRFIEWSKYLWIQNDQNNFDQHAREKINKTSNMPGAFWENGPFPATPGTPISTVTIADKIIRRRKWKGQCMKTEYYEKNIDFCKKLLPYRPPDFDPKFSNLGELLKLYHLTPMIGRTTTPKNTPKKSG